MNYHKIFHSIKLRDSSSFSSLVSELEDFLNEIISTTYIEGYSQDDLNIQKQFGVNLSEPEYDNFKKKLKNASRAQIDDMYELQG